MQIKIRRLSATASTLQVGHLDFTRGFVPVYGRRDFIVFEGESLHRARDYRRAVRHGFAEIELGSPAYPLVSCGSESEGSDSEALADPVQPGVHPLVNETRGDLRIREAVVGHERQLEKAGPGIGEIGAAAGEALHYNAIYVASQMGEAPRLVCFDSREHRACPLEHARGFNVLERVGYLDLEAEYGA